MAASVAQTAFAAIAFAGAGYLFKKFDKNGYEKKMKRHNQALEDLAKAKELFYENEVREHDKIQKLRQEISDANADMNQTKKALDLVKKLSKLQSIQYNGREFNEKPELNHFYKPSR